MTQSRTATIARSLIVPALAVIGLLLFLELFEPWRSNLLWRELFNLGHLPLFGVISLLVLSMTRLVPALDRSLARRYAAAFMFSAMLAALSEIVQIGGPRDADIFDFLRDLVGIVSFLLVWLAFDRRARQAVGTVSRRAILILIAVALVLTSASSVIRLSAVWAERDRAFPTLFTFDNWWERTFVTADNAVISIVSAEPNAPDSAANHLLQVNYRAALYTGPIFQDFYPDWTGYDTLSVLAVSLSPQPEQILFRVDDFFSRKDRTDRFERVIDLKPGRNEITLPLAEIAHGPKGRLLDLSRVKRIVLFSANEPRREFSLRYDNFILR